MSNNGKIEARFHTIILEIMLWFTVLVFVCVDVAVHRFGLKPTIIHVVRKSSDKTTTTNAPIVDSTTSSRPTEDPTNSGGTWLSWNAWLSCSTICGPGIHRRYRTCAVDSPVCDGDYIEVAECNEGPCPVYGKWTTWAPWGSCDVTCGAGSQIRTRICNKTNTEDLDCVGNDQQEKTCSSWNCPDCRQTCTVGVRNQACDTCVCENNIVNGRVISKQTGIFLNEAYIYSTTAPTTPLTQTNKTGFFTLNTTCIMSGILVVREGFVDTTITVEDNYVEVEMTRIVMPRLTQSPRPKYRLTGESVTLCCDAVASPGIEYYEWFRNSLVIESDVSTNGTNMTLHNVTTADSGSYQCRANSPYGAVMSPAATVRIEENPDDFCKESLQQKQIRLPDDCVQSNTNSTLYEVGECVSSSCRLNASNSDDSCGNEVHSCCVMSEAEIRTIQCTNYEMPVVVVKACGCASCSIPSLTLSGSVVDFESGLPVPYAEVWMNGELMSYTSRSGTFTIDVPDGNDQISVTIHDTFIKQYMSNSKVLKLSSGMTGALTIEIKLFKAANPIQIDSSVKNILNAGTSSGGSSIVEFEIPANAFYSPNGTLYNGIVNASLTFLNPTNASLTDDLPGVFEFTDTEGIRGDLDSFGIFNIYFTDSDGQPLTLDKSVDVYVPFAGGSSNNVDNIKLWVLDAETGIWDYINQNSPGPEQREERQAFAKWIGELDYKNYAQYWINVDQIRDRVDRCFFKLRLFDDVKLENQIIYPLETVHLELHYFINDMLRSIRSSSKRSNNGCHAAICDGFYAHISVGYFGGTSYNALFAAKPYLGDSYTLTNGDKVLKIKMEKSNAGPFFDNEASCVASLSPSAPHLRFHYGKSGDSMHVKDFFYDNPSDPNFPIINPLVWYPKRRDCYRVCLVKVRVEILDDELYNVRLKAMSYGGTADSVIGQLFGQEVINIEFSANKTVCIEYKCSGEIFSHYKSEIKKDITKVKILLDVPLECKVTGEKQELIDANLPIKNTAQLGNLNKVYEFYAPVADVYDYGLYMAGSNTKEGLSSAKNNADRLCHYDSGTGNKLDPLGGVAVTFTCKPECDTEWVYDYYYNRFECDGG